MMPETKSSSGRPSSKRPVAVAGRINKILEQVMPLFTPLGVFLGVMFPRVFLTLRPFLFYIFAVITLAGSLKLRARELGKAVSSPGPFIFWFFSTHIIMPVMVFFLSSLIFRNDPETISGYVLLYSVPTAVTGFIWVSIFGGDLALSLAIILLDTLLAPLVVPVTVRLLLRTNVNLDMSGIAVSLVFMVVIPTVIGVVLSEASRGKIPALITPWLTPFSKICLVVVVAVNSAAVAPQIRPGNPRLWLIVAGCVGFSVLGFVCGKLTGAAARLDRGKQVTLFFAAALRNTSAAMTLGIEFFPGAAALPSVLGIMFQQTVAAVMGRVLWGKSGKRENAPRSGRGEGQ